MVEYRSENPTTQLNLCKVGKVLLVVDYINIQILLCFDFQHLTISAKEPNGSWAFIETRVRQYIF